MADSDITGLTANTTPEVGDLLAIVDDPTGTAVTQKITASDFLKVVNGLTEDTNPDMAADFLASYDASASAVKKIRAGSVGNTTGWTERADSWSYASANTITVPSGAASVYKKGMGLRIKQGAGYKYYYISVVADTLLTVTGGTDYTVANSAITDIAYTLSPANAIGFPVTFTCAAPTWDTATIDNGTGGQQPTAGSSLFLIDGNVVELIVKLGATNVVKTGTGTTLSISAIPATLPAVVNTSVEVLGAAFIANLNYVGTVIHNSFAAAIVIHSAASIADNTSIVYTGFRARYRY